MNYAEDRLDRRARYPDGLQLLWKDYCEALNNNNGSSSASITSSSTTKAAVSIIDNTLLAKTLRDAGWNRQALFHFGVAWILQPEAWEKIADYTQMAELSGYPELGLIAVFIYRTRGKLLTVQLLLDHENGNAQQQQAKDASWLEQSAPDGDCGCGCTACGQTVLPFGRNAVDDVLVLLQAYLESAENPAKSIPSLPTANDILKHEALPQPKNAAPWEKELSCGIPHALQFWNDDDYNSNSEGNYLSFPIVLQLLTIKLLYEILPLLAAHAVIFLHKKLLRDAHIQQEMATLYKSHWAYYVLVRAVLLGERTKVSRRRVMPYYHVPVWDLLYTLDRRHDSLYAYCKTGDEITVTTGNRTGQSIRDFLSQWRESILSLSIRSRVSSLVWRLPLQSFSSLKPLFWVGDSHVLSMGWQQLCFGERMRLAVPVVVTGLKAWHVRPETRFFTNGCLQTFLLRLQKQSFFDRSDTHSTCRTIVVSAGEIDCREGVGGKSLQGYTDNCHEHIERTVAEYVRSLQQVLLTQVNIQQILVLPVPPHCQSRKGRVKGRAFRRETTRYWNQVLRHQLHSVPSVYFLDYESHLLLSNDSYILKPALNADSTHMNAAFARHFEQAVMECGCNLDLL